jgi:hypothetical protein
MPPQAAALSPCTVALTQYVGDNGEALKFLTSTLAESDLQLRVPASLPHQYPLDSDALSYGI